MILALMWRLFSSCIVLLQFMKMRLFLLKYRLSRRLLIVIGLRINVSWLKMVVVFGSLEITFCVNWLKIRFVLLFLLLLLQVFKLYFGISIQVLWLDIWAVERC